MTDPPRRDNVGMVERAFNVVRALNLTNILMLALLIVVAIPAYFAYRFMSDENFRSEFMSHAAVLDKHVPCIVFEGRRFGSPTRHTILLVYGIDERVEKVVGLRAPGTMTDKEIDETCKKVLVMANELKR